MAEFLLMNISWLKALHISFMVAWFAGIFYLPRLFVYHAASSDATTQQQFKVMERRLLYFITPFALLTLIFGLAILLAWQVPMANLPLWLHIKFALVALLYAYHLYCFKLLADFRHDRNQRSARWYRVFNELPVLLLFAIIILAVVKPF